MSPPSSQYNNDQYMHLVPPQEELGHFINNQFILNLGNNKKTIPVIQPNNEQIICHVQAGGKEEIELAVQAANKAFEEGSQWRSMGIGARRELMLKFAQLWKQNVEELAALESFNNGSSINVQKFIVADLEKEMYYHIGFMDKLNGRVVSNLSENPIDYHVYNVLEPIGVCGIIVPWNLPLWCLCVKLMPALCCGNTVVIKPSECTPLTALRVAKMFRDVGFPPGVVNIVNGLGTEAGAALATHPLVRKIAFTGSTLVGRQIMRYSADSNLKKVQLELGGKSPVIIFPDVNVQEAAKIALFAIFNNNGQLCTAGSRCFVHESIYDQFIKEAVNQAKGMIIGSQMDPSTQIGPLINKVQFTKVLQYIKTGLEEGGKIEVGSDQPAKERGYFVRPTIFTGLNHKTSRLAREEIFGPVLCVFKFSDKEQAIQMANDTEYGLASAVITKNLNLALEMSSRIEAGTVWVNHYHNTMANTEFGGYKTSGFGREGGEEGAKAWTNSKSVFIHKTNSSL